MKKSRFTEEQILFALKQGDAGQPTACRTALEMTAASLLPVVESLISDSPHRRKIASLISSRSDCREPGRWNVHPSTSTQTSGSVPIVS